MAEAMLSGCVVAMVAPQIHHGLSIRSCASIPADRIPDALSPLVLTLPKPEFGQTSLPAQALEEVMAATSDAELKSKALRAFIVARQMLTPAKRVKNVESLVELWQDGGRGYNVSLLSELSCHSKVPADRQLPHAFSWNCDTEPRPPWC